MSQSIVSNTITASIGRVANILLGVLAISVITRLLKAESYGGYVLLLSYGTLLQIAADLGLYLTLTKKIGESKHEEQNLLSHISSLRLVLLITIFVVGSVWVLTFPNWESLMPAFVLIALGLMFQSISQLCMGVFQAHGSVWRATVGDLIGRIAQIAGLLFLLTTASDLTPGILLTLVAALFWVSTGLAFAIHARLMPLSFATPFKPLASGWQQIVKSSWPLGAMLLLNVIYFRSDTIILAFFRDAAEVGHYGLAYRIIESTLFFPAMFGGLILPRLSQARKQADKEKVKRLLQQTTHLILIASAGIAVVLTGLAKPIIELLSGQAFLPAAPLLQILTIAMVIMFFGNIFGFTLVAYDKQRYLLGLYAILAVGNVIANLIFVPLFGSTAAALTTVATEGVAATAAGILAINMTGALPKIASFIQVAIAAAAAYVVLVVTPEHVHVIVRASLIALTYTAIIMLVRGFDKPALKDLLQKPKHTAV